MKTKLVSLFLALILCLFPLVACDEGGSDPTPPHTHTPGAEATCSSAQLCTGCGDVITPKKPHTPGPEATCKTEQVCTVCGETVAQKKQHLPSAEATCKTEQVCLDCGDVLAGKKPHTPGAEATCKTEQVCTVCGDVVAPKKPHTPGATSCEEDQICTECGDLLAEAGGHSFVWVTDTPATEKETGVKHEACTLCPATRNEGTEIPRLTCAHPEMVGTGAKPADCKSAGNSAYWYCPLCEGYFADEAGTSAIAKDSWVLPVTDHTYASVRSSDTTHHWYAATCGCDVKKDLSTHTYATALTNDATHHWYAATCGCNVKKGYATHSEGDPATCDTAQSCTACRRELVGKLGHDLQPQAAKTPTCTELGWDAYEACSRCDYNTRAPRYGHSYEAGSKVCSLCNTALIYTAADLKAMKRTGNYILMNDIDLGGAEWTPIGDSDIYSFSGTLDGNGYAITNFKFADMRDYKYVGFIGYNRGTVRNLTLKDVNLTAYTMYGEAFVGTLVGYNSGTVENCHVTGKMDLTNRVSYMYAKKDQRLAFGGLIGWHAKSADVKDCHTDLAVTVSHDVPLQSNAPSSSRVLTQKAYIGGLIGYGVQNAVNCYTTGNVTYTFTANEVFNDHFAYVGGVVGEGDSLTDCYATGNVTATVILTKEIDSTSYVGGLAGDASIIEHCHATGNVLADYPYRDVYTNEKAVVGGLVGKGYGISYSYATGNVTARQEFNTSAVSYPLDSYAGGLVGEVSYYNSNTLGITHCYATGDVSSTYAAGGLVASIRNGDISSSYATGNVSAISRTEYSYTYAGGLVAYLDGGTVSACYATGNVTSISYRAIYISEVLGGGIVGHWAGIATPVTNCYVADSQTFNIIKINQATGYDQPTNEHGTPTGMSTLKSLAFQRDTLGWSCAVWQMTDGAHPTLK